MQKDHDTHAGWWINKPERQDRVATFFAPIGDYEKDAKEPVWTKAAVAFTIMIAFGLSLLRLFGIVA